LKQQKEVKRKKRSSTWWNLSALGVDHQGGGEAKESETTMGENALTA